MMDASRLAGKNFRKEFSVLAILLATLVMCVIATSCGDSCVTGSFNFGGSISTGSGSCSLNKASGKLTLLLRSSPAPSGVPSASNLQHIFVTLSGIESHPSTIADENSPDWQELAPDLAKHPLQLDLLSPVADSCASSVIARAEVPAFVYRQIRLQIVSDPPGTGEARPQENACGTVGFNCVITRNGEIRPLILDGLAPELRIATERIAGGAISVLPDRETDVTIEFHRYSSWAAPAGEAVRLVPVLTADAGASCDSPGPLQSVGK
jgi:hypothetical protein